MKLTAARSGKYGKVVVVPLKTIDAGRVSMDWLAMQHVRDLTAAVKED